ncbi:hypothetical protein ABDD95_20655 [Mucilaginibacter sp. PAMB04274]|uniref:hypothetical protein n=1 Tax=Mucilaginibacter sp. PAMB04274 TaxID=3138568 RepID=UPI0031F6B5D1
MNKRLAPLASWISETYQVPIINILYGVGEVNRLPWLEIWFEFSRDLDQWTTQPGAMELDHGKQQAIAHQLNQLQDDRSAHGILSWLPDLGARRFQTEGLRCYGCSFEAIAQLEAHQRIPKAYIQQLQDSIGPDCLWKIDNSMGAAIFFTYTNQILEKVTADGTLERWTTRYYNLLKTYDEFDYISQSDLKIILDSKENFDKNYQGNWYYYYK